MDRPCLANRGGRMVDWKAILTRQRGQPGRLCFSITEFGGDMLKHNLRMVSTFVAGLEAIRKAPLSLGERVGVRGSW